MSVSVTTRVQEILERGAGRNLVELAWEHVDEPYVVREIYSVLRRREPRAAMEAARVRFLEEEQYRRDGKIYRREMYETIEALGGTSARWLPYLIAHADLAAFALVLGRLGDPRAIPALAARLSTAKGPLLAAVIDALGWLRAVECVDALVDLAHTALPSGERDRTGHRRIVANACLALGRIGDSRAMPALLELVTDPAPEMESVVPRAIVALGWMGDGQATHALLPLLEGRYRNISMYSLARIADRSSASHVEATFARISAPPEQIVYPRLMLEALRSRLGRAVDVDVARYALGVVMANRFEATELHETALRLLAVHGRPDELPPLARRFLDSEHPRVRTAAIGAIASAGVVVSPTWLDRPRVDEIDRREGVRGLAGALADPDAVFRHNVIRKAAEVECGAELEGPALGVVRTMVSFPHYSEETVVDRMENAFDALEALARFHTLAADQFLVSLLDHPNVMIRSAVAEIAKVDVYGASEHLREALRRRVEERGAPRPTLPVARLGGGPWVFGPPIRALGVDRAGSRVAALGRERLAIFDADGTPIAIHDDVGAPISFAFERNGERLALAFADGRVRLVDARSGELGRELVLEGAAKTSCVAIAADGNVVLGTRGGRLVKGGERIAWTRRVGGAVVALAVHPDAPHVYVASRDRVQLFDERDGAVRASGLAAAGPIVDLAFDVPTNTVAALRVGKLELYDGATLERKARIALAGGTRVAFARDGRSVLVAMAGRAPGLVRVDLDVTTPRARRIAESPVALRAVAVDPVTSLLMSGGDGVRVDLWTLDGTPSSLPIAQHASRVVAMIADAARGRAFSIGHDGLVLQWDTEAREIVAGWRIPVREPPIAAALGSTGRTLLVATKKALLLLDLVSGGVRWKKAIAVNALGGEGAAAKMITARGLVAVDELATRLRVLDAALKTGTVTEVDDARFAVVQSVRITVFDARSATPLQKLALGRARAVRAAGGEDLGLLVACTDRTLRRFAGVPLQAAEKVALDTVPDVLATNAGTGRVAIACGREVIVLESDLRERARVRLEHPVSAMAFAEAGLLVCGGSGGEVSVIETER